MRLPTFAPSRVHRGICHVGVKAGMGFASLETGKKTRWGTGAWPERQAKKIPGSKSGEGNDCAAREACRLRFSGGRNRRLKSCGPARVTGGSGGTVPQLFPVTHCIGPEFPVFNFSAPELYSFTDFTVWYNTGVFFLAVRHTERVRHRTNGPQKRFGAFTRHPSCTLLPGAPTTREGRRPPSPSGQISPLC